MTTTPPAPTVTPRADANPCPRVEVVISPMPSDAATVTVWRTYNGRRSIVRGGNKQPVAGDAIVVDYDPPTQIDVTYECQTADAAGTPSATSSISAVANINEPRSWMHDPLNPSMAVPIGLGRTYQSGIVGFGLGDYGEGVFGASELVTLPSRTTFRRASFAEVHRTADHTISPVFNSELPMAGATTRRAPSEVPIEIRCDDQDQAAALRQLIAQVPFPCLRTGIGVPTIDPVMYISVPDWSEQFFAGLNASIFSGTAQAVAGPGSPVIVNVRRIDQLSQFSSTISGLSDVFATIIDMGR